MSIVAFPCKFCGRFNEVERMVFFVLPTAYLHHVQKYNKGMNTKTCSKCKQEKDRGEFGKDAKHSDGLRSECKACDAAYRAGHREERAVYHAAWYAEHRDEQAAYNAAYHPTWYAEHREEAVLRTAAWQKANPDKCRAKTHRRRARKLAAGGTHTGDDIRRQGDSQKWKCWWCKEPCTDSYHVDHLIPIARGGHNNPSNIVISCPHCNCSKHDKLPSEFIGRLL